MQWKHFKIVKEFQNILFDYREQMPKQNSSKRINSYKCYAYGHVSLFLISNLISHGKTVATNNITEEY